MVKRQCHTVTAIAVSSSQVVVVVFGGLDEYIRGRDNRQQPMKAGTFVLEFGNCILIIVGSHPHIELICVFVAMQSCSRVGVLRVSGF